VGTARGSRRAARELALRALFQADIRGISAQETIELSFSQVHHAPPTLSFAEQLIRGALLHQPHIDRLIERYARGWTLERMANVDRNILRLATFELLFLPDTPPSVVVDEAVELAKKYSTQESGRFVNGILGNLIRNLHQERAELTGS